MKKVVRDDSASNALSNTDFSGPIDDIIDRLQGLKDRGVVQIDVESYGYDGGVEFYPCRLETDEEKEYRLECEARERKLQRLEEEERQRKKEMRQRKDYERLKKKFETL